MRTTVEISDPLYRRVRALAVERGLRGFSPIVEEALTEYLASESSTAERVAALKAAEGAWNDKDVAQWEEDVRQAWSTWRSDADDRY